MVAMPGMNIAAGPKLAAAVCNSGTFWPYVTIPYRLMHVFCECGLQGGIGVIGCHRQTPKILQQTIDEFKSYLENKDAPFGIDILMPQIGGSARKTNVRFPLKTNRARPECCFDRLIIRADTSQNLPR